MKLEEIKIRVIDTEKLKELFNINVPSNKRLNIKKECVYEDTFMIDTDCIFSEVNQFYHKGIIKKCLLFECSFDTKTDTGWNLSTIRFGKFMTLKEFLIHSELMPLKDFIRYNYNPRIIGNQKLLISYINDLNN